MTIPNTNHRAAAREASQSETVNTVFKKKSRDCPTVAICVQICLNDQLFCLVQSIALCTVYI